jgi:hypothetical protein
MRKLIIIAVLLLSCASVYGGDFIKATDIQKINLGDTFDDVSKKIGEPQQVPSKELTADGKEQVTWLYETIPPPANGGFTHPDYIMEIQSVYQQKRANNPPYLIIFINGKVAKIQRQQVETTPQVNVIGH